MFRDTTPTNRSVRTNATLTGAARAKPDANMAPAADSSGIGSANSGSLPTGNTSVERASIEASAIWASVRKNKVTPTTLIRAPMTFWFDRDTGSNTEPMPKPIWTSSRRPATARTRTPPARRERRTRAPCPRTLRPPRTARAIRASERSDQGVGRGGTADWERAASSTTRTRRTIAGTPNDENAGDRPMATVRRTDSRSVATTQSENPTPPHASKALPRASVPEVMSTARAARARARRRPSAG